MAYTVATFGRKARWHLLGRTPSNWPFEFKGIGPNYSATSNNYEVGTLAVDGWLLYLVQRGGD